jgi:hypothetical protein
MRAPDRKSPVLKEDFIVKLGFSVKEIWSDPGGLVSVIQNSFMLPKGRWSGKNCAGAKSIHRDLSLVNGLDMRWDRYVNQLHRTSWVERQF